MKIFVPLKYNTVEFRRIGSCFQKIFWSRNRVGKLKKIYIFYAAEAILEDFVIGCNFLLLILQKSHFERNL